MATTQDQNLNTEHRTQKAFGQVCPDKMEQLPAKDAAATPPSEAMDSGIRFPQQEPVSEEKGGGRWSTMNHQMEKPQSGSSVMTSVQAELSACDDDHESLHTAVSQEQQPGNVGSSLHDNGDYFPQSIPEPRDSSMRSLPTTKRPAELDVAEFADPSSSIKLPQGRAYNPVSTHNPGRDEVVPESHLSAEHEPTWKDCATQTVIGPTTFKPGSTRPTSVPNFKSKPGSRGRRDGPSYPNYPDQSFAALQSQYYPPPYQPHPLRTRSSQPSHSPSCSSDSSAQPREFSSMSSGAKTVGNTPAQSPGLFSPSTPRNRPATQGSDDSAVRTPTLHPAHNLHLQAPIE